MNYQIPKSCQVVNLNKIYLEYFGYKNEGFFVDVGAFDGYLHSNTWGLAVAGWRGICYEPLPEAFSYCVANHKDHRVLSVNTCVGNKTGTIEFNSIGVLSTYNTDYLNCDFWKNEYAQSQKIIVPIVTLDESLHKFETEQKFDVLSLDVEGSETDVLTCFDIDYWQPKMCIVEVQELHPSKQLSLQAPFINKYFDNAGYEKIYCDIINNIYVRK